jgi:hypothetical protein
VAAEVWLFLHGDDIEVVLEALDNEARKFKGGTLAEAPLRLAARLRRQADGR